MKKLLLTLVSATFGVCISASLFAQTVGTLTFSFTPIAHSPCYQGTNHVMAVWIQTSAGGFVKTKLRYCCGGSTSDHLPAWGANAGGTAGNCTAGNKTDATTGATLSTWNAQTIIWDGKNVNGTANGTTVADGAYQVTIQETWNHGTASTVTRSFAFTKGPNPDHQTPAADANFTGIKLDWLSATTNVEDNALEIPGVNVYPSPSNDGIFNVDFEKASNIKVVNLLGITLYDAKVDQTTTTKKVDLSNASNGIYFIYVYDGDRSSKRKVILNK